MPNTDARNLSIVINEFLEWVARGEFLAKAAAAHGEAQHAYEIAIGLEHDPAVRRFLQQRQSALPRSPPR